MEDQNATYIIGADSDADIHIDAPVVSGRHARLTQVGGGFVLEDLGSKNGTWVDGARVTAQVVRPGQRIGLGKYLTDLDKLLGARRGGTGPTDEPRRAAGAVQTLEVGETMRFIGRDSRCDVCVPESGVSGRHARAFRNCGRLIVEDAGSRNGTRVNGKGVAWQVLRADDVVEIGSQRLQLRRAPRNPDVKPIQGAQIDVSGVSVDVPDSRTGAALRLLHDLTFTVLPGEIAVVMGPAGCGKTTLLKTMCGMTAPTEGSVRIGGVSVYEASCQPVAGLTAVVGYAPQDDIVHELLTVQEAIRYQARLRCPATVGDAELEVRVQQAIADVGLTERAAVRIGSATSKSLSGGQRKRVNIAMELVTDAPVLFLDEPTSGLSSADAADLMTLLRRLADSGRTIVLTIHQPSYAMFVQADHLVLLDAGRLAWFGPTAIDVFEFFEVPDRSPAAILERLAQDARPGTVNPWVDRFAASKYHKTNVEARVTGLGPPRALLLPPVRSGLAALATLVRRGLLLKTRDRSFWLVALVVPAIVALLFRLVIGVQLDAADALTPVRAHVEHQFLLVLTIMVCFFGALSAALEIFNERAVLQRGRRAGLGVLPYIASKALLYAIPAVTHPAVSIAVLQAADGTLNASFGGYMAVLVPAFFAAASAGLALSAVVRSAEGVIGLAVSYAIVQTVFSVFAPLSVAPDGAQAKTHWLQVVSGPITARWALSDLVTRTDLCCPAVAGDGRTADGIARALACAGDLASSGVATGDLGLPESVRARLPDTLRLPGGAALPDPLPGPPGECVRSFYRNHGVTPAQNARQRTGDKHLHRSWAANGFLSLFALFCAGVVLRRRTD